MADITNKEILQAIKDLSGDVHKLDRKVDCVEKEMKEIKTDMTEMRTDLKQDIRKLDQKFKLILGDLLEARTDITMLQQAND